MQYRVYPGRDVDTGIAHVKDVSVRSCRIFTANVNPGENVTTFLYNANQLSVNIMTT